ncbi:MAG TPA: hypothetical protein VMT71_17700 [Syntrophorhabdales bacterium]|nr:hypothetical protein [Syntrophorhabdales bacterium]
MYQASEKFQKEKQCDKNEQGHEGITIRYDEDDLRIMQHFVRDHIERSY